MSAPASISAIAFFFAKFLEIQDPNGMSAMIGIDLIPFLTDLVWYKISERSTFFVDVSPLTYMPNESPTSNASHLFFSNHPAKLAS